MKWKNKIIIVMLVLLAVLSSCRTAPIAERDAAKAQIEKAKSVDASKYAGDELGVAEEQYQEGEENIVDDKKSGKNKKAFNAFTEADSKAKDAYEKSLVPFVTDKFAEVTKEVEEGETVHLLDRKSPNEFEEAENNLMSAEENLESKNYEATLKKIEETDNALSKANSNAQYLETEIQRLQEEIDELNQTLIAQKAPYAVPDLYNENQESLSDIDEGFNDGYYQDTLEEQIALIASVDEMLEIIEEKRRESARELEIANDKISTAEQNVAASNEEGDSDAN